MGSRVLQDRRKLSRISVQMECRFKSEDKEYGALVLDLSQSGALISSTLLPAEESIFVLEHNPPNDGNFPARESKISITVEANELKMPLTLNGTIKRSAIGMSEYGRVAQFGVEFEHTPLELLRLISILSSRRKQARISTKMRCWYVSDDKEYEATMLDISKNGALLSSMFLPAPKNKIVITLQTDILEAPLTLPGIVVRSAMSRHWEGGQFGVEFENPPSELSRLVNAISSERKFNNKEQGTENLPSISGTQRSGPLNNW